MTDDRTTTDPAGMAVEPEQIIPPEQPPMDDAAEGSKANPESAPDDEKLAAELGDFA